MTTDPTPPSDHPAFDVKPVAGMKPWACTYIKDGEKFGITLYGTDAEQVLEDNCDRLDGLSVEGELAAKIPVNDKEAWAKIKKHGDRQ